MLSKIIFKIIDVFYLPYFFLDKKVSKNQEQINFIKSLIFCFLCNSLLLDSYFASQNNCIVLYSTFHLDLHFNCGIT